MAIKKLHLADLRPQQARAFRYLQVPKLLMQDENYAPLDEGAVLLYSLMLERAGLSAQNADKFTDENGRFYIIFTVEQMMLQFQRSRPTIIKWTKQLAEIGLIEKVRQGQGKPSRIYIMDFSSVDTSEPGGQEVEPQEVKKVDLQKSKNLTSGSKNALPLEVKNFYPIELKDIELDNKNLPTCREEGVEEVIANVQEQVEYPVLCERYGQDLADEAVSLIAEVHCRHGPVMKIGTASYPLGFVKARMRALTFEHIAYALDNLGRAGPVRNPHNYLLALLFNAPAGCSAAIQAQYNADFAN